MTKVEGFLRHSSFVIRHSSLVIRHSSFVICLLHLAFWTLPAQAASMAETIAQVQPKIVKIYGAGGLQGLEAYQTGFLISAEGHVLTVWSYVLDAEDVTVVLHDGRRFTAKLLGADPRLEIAVLKFEAESLDHFDLEQAVDVPAGTRVLAFSNLFGVATGDEAASVQKGAVAAKTNLAARRGAYQTPYDGPVYVLDAMTNNPGAAGGALVNLQGQLLGLLGKELRNSLNNVWLNYAVPVDQLRETVEAIREGKYMPRSAGDSARKPENPLRLEMLGLVMVPDVLERTPPFIDEVRPNTPASRAGLKPDDVVVFIGGRLVQSVKALMAEVEYIDREDEVQLTVVRGQELLDVKLKAGQE
jgi:serine protease Do